MMNDFVFRSNYPYKSSTIYNVMASVTSDFENLTIYEKVQKARPLIFDFDYTTPENVEAEDFKYYFETMFISRYFQYYFKTETFEAWKLLFYSKMLEVMPVYTVKLSFFFTDNIEDVLLNMTETVTNGKNRNKSISAALPADIIRAGYAIENVDRADSGNLQNGETETVTTVKNGALINALSAYSAEFNNIFGKLLSEFETTFSAVLPI